MSYSTLNIQANLQIFPPELQHAPESPRMPGQQSCDFQAIFRRHHDCDEGGWSDSCGGDHGCGDDSRDQLSVNGNSVNTGRYTISASTGDSGTLTVKDNVTGESFKVWGDPHIATDKGDTTQFQHAPATFDLPDGTRITVDPTDNSGVNYINNVTITKGNDAVGMNGFQGGNIQTQSLSGEGHYLDATTPEGTVLRAHDGNIDQLELPNGTLISGNNVNNIDGYANERPGSGQWSQQIGQLRQEIAQLEQEVNQLEQGMSCTSLSINGFMSDPFKGCSFN